MKKFAAITSAVLLLPANISAQTFYSIQQRVQNDPGDVNGSYLYVMQFNPEDNTNTAVSRYLYRNSSSQYTNNFRADWAAPSQYYFNAENSRIYVFGTRDDDTSDQAYIYYDIENDSWSSPDDVASSGFNGATSGNQEIRSIPTGGWATGSSVTTLSNLVNNPNNVQVTSTGVNVGGKKSHKNRLCRCHINWRKLS